MKMMMNFDTKSSKVNQEASKETTTTNTKASKSHIKLPMKPRLCYCYCHYYYLLSFLILLNSLLFTLSSTEASATLDEQLTTNKPKPTTTTSQLYPITAPFLQSTPLETTSTTTTTPITTTRITSPTLQTKTFKFTLTAGRFWKFNIKLNSLPQISKLVGGDCAGQCELRLHRNISLNNYIIDDYGWFQYNAQHQQFFAWPTLLAKPGTYYFVLLPSGLDYDAADDESFTPAPVQVVANIIVQLLTPIYAQPFGKDIDLYLDHKFSLEYLDRLPAYPLLLNQIIAVLDSLTKSKGESLPNNNTNQSLQTTQQVPSTTSNPGSTTLATYLHKITKQAPKLTEVVLINYNYFPDGNLFSLTWSTHPSILNGTINYIEHCRIPLINETVSKLSSLSLGFIGYNNPGETNIYYPIDVPPPLNLQAIVFTERGNYTLKLTLNGPCRNETAIEKLVEQPKQQEKTLDDRDNNIILDTSAKLSNVTFTNHRLSSTNSEPSSYQSTSLPIANKTSLSAIAAVVSENPSRSIITTDTNIYLKDQQADKLLTTVRPQPKILPDTTTLIYSPQAENRRLKTLSALADGLDSQPSQQPPVSSSTNVISSKSFPLNSATTNEANSATRPPSNGLRSQPPPFVPIPKRVVQQKSFGKFLRTDQSESRERSINMPNNNSTEVPMIPSVTFRTTTLYITSPASNVGVFTTTTDSSNVTDTTFNEDIMVIFEGFMEHFESLAVPVVIVVGVVLIIACIIALTSLCLRRKRAQHFQIRNRYSLRYGSERKGFLKTCSKPVILEADQKMISSATTPLHKAPKKKVSSLDKNGCVGDSNYYPMYMFLNTESSTPTGCTTGYYPSDSHYDAGSSGFNGTPGNHD